MFACLNKHINANKKGWLKTPAQHDMLMIKNTGKNCFMTYLQTQCCSFCTRTVSGLCPATDTSSRFIELCSTLKLALSKDIFTY